MFNPSREDVRAFFAETWRKHQTRQVLTPLETMAAQWMREHPEYSDDLATGGQRNYSVEAGATNPFLHLSMHLAIDEQVSIDQPAGIRDACLRLARKLDSMHAAHHAIMECLGEMLWTAQRAGAPPDGAAYVECVKKRATVAS